jgi:hypothetical protein
LNKKKRSLGKKEKRNDEISETMVAKVAQQPLEECKSLKKKVETDKD